MTNVEGPRLATEAEFPELTALVDCVFGFERGGMAARRPITYEPDAPERHAVILEDGEVVSHAAAIPETLVVGPETRAVESASASADTETRGTGTDSPATSRDSRLRCWGIGGVATAPEKRGNGYMSDLLEFWLTRIDEAGVPLSELGGDRQRYSRYGWETTGRELVYELTPRSVRAATENKVNWGRVTEFDGRDGDVESLTWIHGDEPLRVERGPSGTRTVLGKRGLETHVARDRDGDPTAYLAFTRDGPRRTVQEFGGSEDGLAALVSNLYRTYDTTEVSVPIPPNHPRGSLFERLSANWCVRSHRMLRVCNLPAVLDAFEGQLSHRWARVPGDAASDVTLGIDSDDASVRLTFGADGTVEAEPADRTPDLELDRRAMTRLLFGTPGSRRALEDRFPALAAVLPLAFYVWRSEWV